MKSTLFLSLSLLVLSSCANDQPQSNGQDMKQTQQPMQQQSNGKCNQQGCPKPKPACPCN